MRLLLTTDTVGGVWTFTRELTLGLLARGHHVALVSLGRLPSPEQQLWADTLASPHFSFHPLDVPLEWMNGNDLAYTAAEPTLLRLVDTFAPDLLHTSQFCFGALPIPQPRLVTAHSDVLTWAAACRPNGLEPSPWLTTYRHLVQRGLHHATAVAAPTAAYLATLTTHWPTAAPTHVIPNGRSLPSAPPAPRRKLQAITAGRLWDEAKNIASLQSVTAAVPILIAGEQQLSPAHTAHLPPTLTVTGHLAEPALFHLFRESALYIAPALYEPFGLAPLEAALSGCALLLHDLPTFRELWNGHALFFSTAAERDRHLTALTADPALLTRLQHLAQARAARLTRDRMTDSYLALYTSLLASGVAHVA